MEFLVLFFWISAFYWSYCSSDLGILHVLIFAAGVHHNFSDLVSISFIRSFVCLF